MISWTKPSFMKETYRGINVRCVVLNDSQVSREKYAARNQTKKTLERLKGGVGFICTNDEEVLIPTWSLRQVFPQCKNDEDLMLALNGQVKECIGASKLAKQNGKYCYVIQHKDSAEIAGICILGKEAKQILLFRKEDLKKFTV